MPHGARPSRRAGREDGHGYRAAAIWLAGLAVAFLALVVFAPAARAGSYIVAQCAPGLFAEAPEASYGTSSSHFTETRDCSEDEPGMQVGYRLAAGETGTEQGGYGAWVWEAPPGTYITGGSAYSRLASEDGIAGYLVVSPDSGPSLATESQNDNQLHLSAIPAGNWRYFVDRLECLAPNQNGRCVGGGSGAHAYVKQLRLELTDVSQPSLAIGGSMFSGAELRGPQTIDVNAADQGAGLQSVQIAVNGLPAGGDNLSASCNPLPGGLTSRLSPCPPSFVKTYTLDTAKPPFANGANTVSVCVYDYAQIGTPNSACQSRQVITENLCPSSAVGGGSTLNAGFAANGKAERTFPYGSRALIRGRVLGAGGNGVAGATVCVEGHTELPGLAYQLLGIATTNQNGGWSYELGRGASRAIRVAYRFGATQTSTDLSLAVRADAALELSKNLTRPHRRVFFSGAIPGPLAAKRVVIVCGTVPGARRRFLVRRARTDALGHFRVGYAFSPVAGPTKFVFWVVVPEQNSYPYSGGRSPRRYIWVRP